MLFHWAWNVQKNKREDKQFIVFQSIAHHAILLAPQQVPLWLTFKQQENEVIHRAYSYGKQLIINMLILARASLLYIWAVE